LATVCSALQFDRDQFRESMESVDLPSICKHR
jgi:hypothetical protein